MSILLHDNVPTLIGNNPDGSGIWLPAGAAYNNVTGRADVAALMPEQVSRDLLGKDTQESAVLQMFRSVPVSGQQTRMPVLTALPIGYWVSGGDTGLKQTTEMAWSNKYLNIEEIATILPVPENVIDDLEDDIFDEALPLIREAFGRVLDTAVFFGTNAPGSFPTNILTAAAAAGNVVDEGTNNAAAGGFFGDIDDVHGKVEDDGYDVTGWVGPTSLKRRLRKTRDTTGRKLDEGRTNADFTVLDGAPVSYPMRGLWPVAGGAGVNGVRAIGGDWSQFVVGVRKDISLKILDQAVITDGSGAVIFNLPQQDMIALRVTFRVGWQVANTINNDQPTEANRYPVAYLRTLGA